MVLVDKLIARAGELMTVVAGDRSIEIAAMAGFT